MKMKQMHIFCYGRFLASVFCIFILQIVYYSYAAGDSPSHSFVTLNNTKARPLALGGAFFSLKGDIETVFYNPAGFELLNPQWAKGFTVFINPVLPFVVWRHSENFDYGKELNVKDFLSSLRYLFPAFIYMNKSINLGVLCYEEALQRGSSERFFESEYFHNNSYTAGFASIWLAKRVRLGATGVAYTRRTPNGSVQKWGGSYGLLIQPSNRTSIGIAYFDMPPDFAQFRNPLEHIEDESINVGISFQYNPRFIFSVDIRNVSEPEKKFSKEIHFGLEGNIYKHTTLRTGYYSEKIGDSSEHLNVFSFGIGLIDLNEFRPNMKRLLHRDYLLNYAVLGQRVDSDISWWHFLNIHFRL